MCYNENKEDMEEFNMKKIYAILSFVMISACLTACGNSDNDLEYSARNSETQSSASEEINESEIEATEQTTEKITESSETGSQESVDDSGKILVAYFSATGTTMQIAESISLEINADLYEIQPVQAYTDEDLNYSNANCRANIEQNNKSARPEISENIADINEYDTVFLGYPIWWGEEPRIIDTFMESYDFSDITIIPFCTSGGSGIATSENNLKEICPNANWLDGKRFSDNSEVSEWVNSLNFQEVT